MHLSAVTENLTVVSAFADIQDLVRMEQRKTGARLNDQAGRIAVSSGAGIARKGALQAQCIYRLYQEVKGLIVIALRPEIHMAGEDDYRHRRVFPVYILAEGKSITAAQHNIQKCQVDTPRPKNIHGLLYCRSSVDRCLRHIAGYSLPGELQRRCLIIQQQNLRCNSLHLFSSSWIIGP